jgi:hypothetical protein
LRFAWGAHIFSITCGVWSLMALTGTLMPVDGKIVENPQFGGNVRFPAAAQVVLFVTGTALLTLTHGRTAKPKRACEYRIFRGAAQDEIDREVERLAADRWEILSVCPSGNEIVVLLRR